MTCQVITSHNKENIKQGTSLGETGEAGNSLTFVGKVFKGRDSRRGRDGGTRPGTDTGEAFRRKFQMRHAVLGASWNWEKLEFYEGDPKALGHDYKQKGDGCLI